MKLSELQSKSIITQDGRLMGRIIDVIIKENGNIESIIVEKSKFIISLFSNKNELVIKFNEILKIGDDVILVNIKE